MIEIVFGESACGSLKIAQTYGKGKYRGSAVSIFIAVRRSWDVWSGIPVHLQVFWQMSAIVVMYWQERPLHRTF